MSGQESNSTYNQASMNNAVDKLFIRLKQEIEDKAPSNPIYFIVDFLCKAYPQHLGGFASIWDVNPELERERIMVVEFFRFNKLPTEIAAHFTLAGFDTLDTICALTIESLSEIEKFNNAKWLPGHKIRLAQVFSDIPAKVRHYRQEREKLMQLNRITTGYCNHPTVLTRTNIRGYIPAVAGAPNPVRNMSLENNKYSNINMQPNNITTSDLKLMNN